MKKYLIGLLPLSGDPLTWGHINIIQRAGEKCAKLIIAILENPDKAGQHALDEDERINNIKKAMLDFCPTLQAEVLISKETLTNIFLEENCDVLFRGIRDKFDQEYEEQQLYFHEMLLPGISKKTIFLRADPRLKNVQSTVARNFAMTHLDASELVPMFIQSRLWYRLHHHKIIGITGQTGVGKTTLINSALETIRKEGLPAHHIDLGKIRQEILLKTNPGTQALAEKIQKQGSTWDQKFWALYKAHLSIAYRNELQNRKGIILVEDSYLVEDELCHWVNNNIIVLSSDDFGLDKKDERTYRPSWEYKKKLAQAMDKAQKDKHGEVFSFVNNADTFKPGLGGLIVAKAKSGGY